MNSPIFSLFATLLQSTSLKYILLIPGGLILLDFITGVVSALRTNTFNAKLVANFLAPTGNGGKFLTVLIATFTAFLFSGSNVTVTMTATATMVVMAYSLIASIAENLSEIFPNQKVEIQMLAQDADQLLGQQFTHQQPSPVQQSVQSAYPSFYSPVQPGLTSAAPPVPSVNFGLSAPQHMAPYASVTPVLQQPLYSQSQQQQQQQQQQQPQSNAAFNPTVGFSQQPVQAVPATFVPPVVTFPHGL